MYNILKLNKISPVIKDVFTKDYVLSDDAVNPDGILVRSAQMADYQVDTNLVAIARAGAGVNNIPVQDMAKKGVVVFNTPGANANAVKELVLCSMFLASRDIIGGNKWVNTLTENVAKSAEKGKSAFGGHEIFGKTLGVIGLGAIGRLVANAAIHLGMNVIGYDPYLNDSIKNDLNDNISIADFDTVVKTSDILTIHVPYMDSTKGMINAGTIAEMKDGVIILNLARGELVDVNAVKEALASGKVKKYVVDFPSEDVLNQEGIIVMPHLGASTEEAEDNCAVMAGKELVDYIENGNITNSVNYPALKKARVNGMKRTTVLFNAEDKNAIDLLPGDKLVAVRGAFGYAIIDNNDYVDAPNAIRIRNI